VSFFAAAFDPLFFGLDLSVLTDADAACCFSSSSAPIASRPPE
jgi:hypothetical protein